MQFFFYIWSTLYKSSPIIYVLIIIEANTLPSSCNYVLLQAILFCQCWRLTAAPCPPPYMPEAEAAWRIVKTCVLVLNTEPEAAWRIVHAAWSWLSIVHEEFAARWRCWRWCCCYVEGWCFKDWVLKMKAATWRLHNLLCWRLLLRGECLRECWLRAAWRMHKTLILPYFYAGSLLWYFLLREEVKSLREEVKKLCLSEACEAVKLREGKLLEL